jgi:hypothetical protein
LSSAAWLAVTVAAKHANASAMRIFIGSLVN